jgi:O-glycosyl hydrolase
VLTCCDRYLCGTTGHSCSSGDWRQAYANFLVQYVKYYAQEGIPITHIGFLNEPDYVVSYSNMQISLNAQEATSFIPTLFNTLKSNSLSSVKIACCDAVGWGSQNTYTTNLVNAGMTQYLGVITSHSYSKDAIYLGQTSLPKWNTEAGTGGSYRLVTTWYSNGALNEGFTWALKLADAMLTAQLSAYLYWEGYEKNQQQSGSHLIDSADGSTITVSGIYYAFAMWSRYIRPGAKRIGVSGTLSGVSVGAFENTDGSIVAVFTNSGSSAQSAKIAIQGVTAGSASAWVTSNGNNFASTSASVSGGQVTVSVPAKGVVTVKIAKGSGSVTTSAGGNPTTTSRAGVSTTSRAAATTSRASSGNCAALYGQCGGSGWTGATCCAQGTCKFSNDWYSQCL